VYQCIGLDPLHQLDIGIFGKHLFAFLKESIIAENSDKIAESKFGIVNQRFSEIPSFPGLRVFSTGVTVLAQTTAVEWRNIMKVWTVSKYDIY
jgi:hypothetical protein